jgi:hypothetical protein
MRVIGADGSLPSNASLFAGWSQQYRGQPVSTIGLQQPMTTGRK